MLLFRNINYKRLKNTGFANRYSLQYMASLTKLILRSSYIGHTINTCSSSSMQEAQWKQTRPLKSKFWWGPVSILIGAVPDLNLARDPLYMLSRHYFKTIWFGMHL